MATVATGMPRGIWTIDSSESQPTEVFGWNRDADDGQMGFCREHAGQVGCPSRPRNDHFNTSRVRLLGICKQTIGRTMCRDDDKFIGNSQLIQDGHGLFENGKIRLASTQHTDDRAGPTPFGSG